MSYPNQPPQGGYPQNPYGQPPQGYPPNPYGQPQYGGYPPPPYGYPPKRNNTPLIIGGIVGLIAVVAIIIVVLLASNSGASLKGTWYTAQNGGYTITFTDSTYTQISDSGDSYTDVYTHNGDTLSITYQGQVQNIKITKLTSTELILSFSEGD